MLKLPERILRATFQVMASCGKSERECVVYWTGPVQSDGVIDGWDHPTHRSSPVGYQIDDTWLTKHCFRIAREKRAIRAQVHTHPGEAFHSHTDDEWPVIAQPEFVSIVIPYFATGPTNFDHAWGGVLTTEGNWRHTRLSEIIEVVS